MCIVYKDMCTLYKICKIFRYHIKYVKRFKYVNS